MMSAFEVRRGIPAALRRLWTDWAAWIFAGGWVLLGGYLVFQQHAAFHTHLFDTGYYTQVLWNTSRGRWFANSLKYPVFLADHFSPALLLLAPLFWIAPNSYPLQLAKIVALAAPVIPLYLLMRTKHPALAPLLVLAYVLNPLLHQTALEEFHEIMLAAPAIGVACYAARRDNVRLLLGSLGLLLLVREDMGIYVALFGVYLLCFYRGWRRLGIGVLLAGLVWVAVMATAVLPLLRSGTPQALGGAQASARLLATLTDPRGLLLSFFTANKGWAVLALLLPLAGLPLLARGEQVLWGGSTLFLLALPLSPVGALSDWYVAPLIPLLWAGAALALSRLSFRKALLGAGLLLASTCVCFYLWSPFPGGKAFIPAEYVVTKHHRIGHELLAQIPAEAAVVTQSGLGAHLAAREQIALYPWNQRKDQPALWVFDTQNQDIYPLTPDEFWAVIDALRHDPAISTIHDRDGYLVFQVDGNFAR
ncbi:MAG TPA: DUF2079 domain-containing protein [Roseiflexaceae bacterium]